MLKHLTLFVSCALLVLSPFALAVGQDRDEPKPPGDEGAPPAEGEKKLTLDEIIKSMKEIAELMAVSEEYLSESAKGKSIETQKEVLEKIKKLLEQDRESKDPSAAELQKNIMKMIEQLLKKTEKNQQGTLDKLDALIKKAKDSGWNGSGEAAGQPQEKQQADKQQKPGQKSQGAKQKSGSPATKPYNPNQSDPANLFKSTAERSGIWGLLPPKVRELIQQGERDIDKYPPEYRDKLQEYFKKWAEETR